MEGLEGRGSVGTPEDGGFHQLLSIILWCSNQWTFRLLSPVGDRQMKRTNVWLPMT